MRAAACADRESLAASRAVLRAAVFLWIAPLVAALDNSFAASRKAASLLAESPEASASSAPFIALCT